MKTSTPFLLILAALGILAAPCCGALTVIAREPFQNVGTLNAATSGAFSGFANGAWQKRAVGPRTAAITAPGWGGDAQGADTDAYFDLTSGPYNSAQQNGMIGCWVRFVDFAQGGFFNNSGSANPAMILQILRGTNPYEQSIGVTSLGHIISYNVNGATDGGVILPHTWYWMQVAWTLSGNTRTMVASYKALGASSLTLLNSATENNGLITSARIRNQPFTYPPATSQNYRWRGRIGNVTLCSIASFSDATIPADDFAPPAKPSAWYVNPATGNDNNPGTSAASAWASVAKFNAESANAGLFGSSTYQGGDTVFFDTSAAPLDPGASQLLAATPNITLQPAAGQSTWTLKAWKDISGGSTTWAQYNSASYPNVWTTTDGGAGDLGDSAYGNVCVWENDVWLTHPNGPAITNVAATLDATPGSFWVSPTAIYLHTADGSNPNTNGKIYTRSRNRGGTGGGGNGSGASLVYVTAPAQIIGLYARKTCLVRGLDGDPYNGYGIQFDGAMPVGSTSHLLSCYVDYASKHGIGRTDSSSAHAVVFDACEVEQCSPYSSNSPFVDYNGNLSATGNISNWNNCVNRYPSGVVGYVTPDYPVTGWPQTASYLSHNNGSGAQYASIGFFNPVFGGSVSGAPAIAITILGGNILSATFNAPAVIQQCTITGYAPSLTTGSLLRNCRIVSTQAAIRPDVCAYLSGSVQIVSNTFDFGHPYQVILGNAAYPLFTHKGPLQLIFENNAVITPAGQDFRLLKNATNADTLTFSHNAYDLGGGGYVLDSYNDGTTTANRTLAQTQALGLDAGSFAAANLQLDANGFPAPESPLVDVGLNLGALADFTGRVFNARRTVGALEPLDIFARWQAQHFSAGQTTGSGEPDADPDGDGRSNLLEYAAGTDPKTTDGGAAASALLPVDGRSYLALTYRQLEYSADLIYTPEVSDDLVHWESGPGAVAFVSRVDNGDGTATQTVRDALPGDAGPARFLRLRVTQSP